MTISVAMSIVDHTSENTAKGTMFTYVRNEVDLVLLACEDAENVNTRKRAYSI